MFDQGGSKRRFLRLVPLVLALLAIAWALGSLPSSQPGGSWLVNSYWLLYLTAFLPLIALGFMVALVLGLAFFSKDMSRAIGWGIAKSRAGKKGSQLIRILVFIGTWALALVTLALHNSLGSTNATSGLQDKVTNDSTGLPSSGLSGPVGAATFVTSLVRSDWFVVVFLGLIIVGGVIFARGVRESMQVSKEMGEKSLFESPQTEGLVAVQDAIKIVQKSDVGGPRERIVACYETMITAASRMGANVTPDLTARELEASIRRSFLLKGDGIMRLTGLFEEARYSLHPITEEDSQTAYSSLLSIEQELRSSISKSEFPG